MYGITRAEWLGELGSTTEARLGGRVAPQPVEGPTKTNRLRGWSPDSTAAPPSCKGLLLLDGGYQVRRPCLPSHMEQLQEPPRRPLVLPQVPHLVLIQVGLQGVRRRPQVVMRDAAEEQVVDQVAVRDVVMEHVQRGAVGPVLGLEGAPHEGPRAAVVDLGVLAVVLEEGDGVEAESEAEPGSDVHLAKSGERVAHGVENDQKEGIHRRRDQASQLVACRTGPPQSSGQGEVVVTVEDSHHSVQEPSHGRDQEHNQKFRKGAGFSIRAELLLSLRKILVEVSHSLIPITLLRRPDMRIILRHMVMMQVMPIVRQRPGPERRHDSTMRQMPTDGIDNLGVGERPVPAVVADHKQAPHVEARHGPVREHSQVLNCEGQRLVGGGCLERGIGQDCGCPDQEVNHHPHD
mmetsp:Transcript_69143/g.158774  ORF Transcript_69143/g.158774 Transcript_69143/m.158774 type:complete len:405 (+) Transcript_69143:30-1244(+)